MRYIPIIVLPVLSIAVSVWFAYQLPLVPCMVAATIVLLAGNFTAAGMLFSVLNTPRLTTKPNHRRRKVLRIHCIYQ